LIIVIPESDSSFCGLADHACVLATELELLGESVQIGHWRQFQRCSPASSLLLQFTPLAYSRIGFSLPLLVQLWRWKRRGCRVISYFHELPFPNGRQWKRRLAVVVQQLYGLLLVRLSFRVLVNQESGLDWLCWLGGRDRVSYLPVFSNIGQLASVAEPMERPLQVVVFGSAGKRRHAHALSAALGGYRHIFGSGVRVLDLGEPLADPSLLSADVECLGPLPATLAFQQLLQSRYGFFYSEPDQFSKSGVFAAYCAAGVVPVIAYGGANRSEFYLTVEELVASSDLPARSASVWSQARDWSSRFNASSAAARIRLLFDQTS